MRYADMLSRLKHRFPTDESPGAADDVFVLEPTINGAYGYWLPWSEPSPTPDEVNGIYAWDYLQNGKPLPAEFVPRSLRIEGHRYIPWPEGVPHVMPDFYHFRVDETIVSSSVRAVLDTLVPGCIEYIEINLVTPPSMVRADRYYYINVLPRSQQIDWERIGPARLCRNSQGVPFKPITATAPLIWHEVGLDQNHRFYEGEVLLRGVLRNKLIEHFPLQLCSMKIS